MALIHIVGNQSQSGVLWISNCQIFKITLTPKYHGRYRFLYKDKSRIKICDIKTAGLVTFFNFLTTLISFWAKRAWFLLTACEISTIFCNTSHLLWFFAPGFLFYPVLSSCARNTLAATTSPLFEFSSLRHGSPCLLDHFTRWTTVLNTVSSHRQFVASCHQKMRRAFSKTYPTCPRSWPTPESTNAPSKSS